MCLAGAGCGSQPNAGDKTGENDQTWAVYWYLCGSDLESWYGCATEDLEEMLAVDLPKNVQVIVQTGGALEWFRDDIEPDRIGRYIYDSKGFRLLE